MPHHQAQTPVCATCAMACHTYEASACLQWMFELHCATNLEEKANVVPLGLLYASGWLWPDIWDHAQIVAWLQQPLMLVAHVRVLWENRTIICWPPSCPLHVFLFSRPCSCPWMLAPPVEHLVQREGHHQGHCQVPCWTLSKICTYVDSI